MKAKRKVLVTGGGGYIGSVLCEKLLSTGYRVIIYDRFYFGKKPLAGIRHNSRLKIVKGDIRNTKKVSSLLEPGMSVIHLASLSNDPSCDLNPGWSVLINHEAAVRLASEAGRAGCGRFLYASSCSVYGYGKDKILKESSECDPVSLYAKLKLQTESNILKLTDNSFQPVMLRQATIFGLSPRMRFDLAINQMTMHAITRGKIFVLGGGRQWRPFIHVQDAASVYIKALEADPATVSGRIFNVGSTVNNFRIADLAKKVKREIDGVEIEVTPEDPDKRDYNVDFSKIKKRLGFKPQFNVADGIREVAAFIRSNRTRDFNGSDFFNIKRLVEQAGLPAKKGGEPVRIEKLTFAGNRETPAISSTAKPAGVVFDFVKASDAFEVLKRACELKANDKVVIGRACDAWLTNCIKRTGLKPVLVEMEKDSFALSAQLTKPMFSELHKAIFYSDFDTDKSINSSTNSTGIALTSGPPETAVLRRADVLFWKCAAVPEIGSAPSARLFIRRKTLAKKIDGILKEWAKRYLETPLGTVGLTERFDALAAEYAKAGAHNARLRRSVAKTDNVTTPAHLPAGSFCLLFKAPKQAKIFKEWAAAENMESSSLPPGWAVSPGGRVNGTADAAYRRSAFLPVGPDTKENDLTDIIRVLEKLLPACSGRHLAPAKASSRSFATRKR